MRRRVMVWVCAGLVGLLPTAALAQLEEGEEAAASESPAAEQPRESIIRITPSGSAAGAPLRISMNLQDADLKDVLKVFSEQSGVNIIATKDAEGQRVTLFLQGVGVQDALDQILRASGLVAERLPQSEIYLVKAAPTGEQGNLDTITRIYKLKYARVSNSVLGRAASSLIKGLTPFEPLGARSLTTGSTQSTGGGLGGAGAGFLTGQDVESGGIDVVIQKMLTEHGTLVGDERTNSLVVTDLQNNFPRIEAAITMLDVKTAQVLIEVELVETTTTKVKDLGLEYGTGSEGTLLAFTPATKATEFPFEESTAANVLATSVASAVGTPTLGFIDASQLKTALKALQKDTDTRILARPKVLTMDNESAVIRLTEDTAISITSTSQTTTGTVATEVERSRTGIILSVTPQVNADGYVTILVEPSVNKPVLSTLTSQGQTILNPKERSARALVRLRDGSTFVLGGLIDRKLEDSIRKVPFLGDIPLLGLAFRKQEVEHTDTELLVFITPHIIKDETLIAAVPPSGVPLMYQRERDDMAARTAVVEESLNRWEQRRRRQE